jgi:hypothetical protein
MKPRAWQGLELELLILIFKKDDVHVAVEDERDADR